MLDLKGLEGINLQIDAFSDKREDPALIGRDMNTIPSRKVTTTRTGPWTSSAAELSASMNRRLISSSAPSATSSSS